MTDPVDAIERRAYAAWPAEEVMHLGGWRLRAMRGVSRRANSVWPSSGALSDHGAEREGGGAPSERGVELESRIERAEAWYESKGLSAAFQLTRRATPRGLDTALERRGYRVDAPVSIQVARARTVLRGQAGSDVQVSREIPDEWFEISAYKGRFARVAEVYRGLLGRIGPRARYALARVDGEPAAVGLGVIDEGWMGIFSMLTLSSHRRRGAGRAILAGLASAALEDGVEDLYLQVERDNAGAAALYAAASFRELYGYHYRMAPGH